MSDEFTGEIRMFGGNYAIKNWTLCAGQLLSITEQPELFSLIGNAFGGDGRSSFAIPDMRGRIPLHWGTGPGLSPCQLGQQMGVEKVTLDETTIPNHTHSLMVSTNAANSLTAQGNVLAKQVQYEDEPGHIQKGPMDSETIAMTGQSDAHNNMMPFLCVNFLMCMKGLYPQRN